MVTYYFLNMASTEGNRKVAKNRRRGWAQNIVDGKFRATQNPTHLLKVRAKIKMSQRVAAKKSGMSVSTYGAIERALRPVKVVKADKIAKLFGTTKGRLFAPIKDLPGKFMASHPPLKRA